LLTRDAFGQKMLTCSAHNWRPDAISGAYQIADLPERIQRLAIDCTSCPVTEEFGQKIVTSTADAIAFNGIDRWIGGVDESGDA
jgi:hypothetical protein